MGAVLKPRFPSEQSQKRQGVRFSAVDFHATSCVVDLVLRDLSSEGMSIETRRPLRVGDSYPFRIRRGQHTAIMNGTVMWCKLGRMQDIGGGESQALYRAGIAFARRLDSFLPLGSIDFPLRVVQEPSGQTDVVDQPVAVRSAISCRDCRVPAIVGALRCRICGTILPQN